MNRRRSCTFFVQSVPTYNITKIVRTIKSIISREVFEKCQEVKKKFWGGGFFWKGYFVNIVGQHGTENKIANYVKSHGIEKEYKVLKTNYQSKLF